MLYSIGPLGMYLALFCWRNDKPFTPEQKGTIMPMFTVSSIINVDTFDVALHWRWENQSGSMYKKASKRLEYAVIGSTLYTRTRESLEGER